MSSSSVRRKSGARKRSISSNSRGAAAAGVSRREWVNEALSLGCGALSLFLAISFLSFRAVQPAMDTFVHPAFRNPMGPAGRITGALLAGTLGWGGLVPVLLLAWLSRYFWYRDDEKPLLEIPSKFLLIVGLAGMLAFACALLSVLGSESSGGSIGGTIGLPLRRIFGLPGATLFLLALLLASIALTTRQTVGNIIKGLFLGTAALLKVILLTLPRASVEVISAGWGAFVTGLAAVGRLVMGESTPSSRMRAIPQPKLRRNKLSEQVEIEHEEDEEEEIDLEEDQEELGVSPDDEIPLPQTTAVVNRKVSDGRLADKELRKVRKQVYEQLKESEVFPEFVPPDLNILTRGEATPGSEDDEELREKSRQIEAKLRDFDILGRVTHIHPGPVVTVFEFEPAPGVKVGKIASLQDDLAMSLKASSIRIVAPIPKRGTVGIEVPNRHREIVRLRDILESEAFIKAESSLTIPVGKDTYGEPVVADLSTMPHLLIAGTTGTGKSVCINAILVSLLYRASPADLGLILIDPKILELSVYDDIPHLRVPVVTVPRQAKAVLDWAVNEMNRRYRMMQKYGVRNIDSYNKFVAGELEAAAAIEKENPSVSETPSEVVDLDAEATMAQGPVDREEGLAENLKEMEMVPVEKLKALPKIVIVIDELADLMLTVGRDIEELITRLAQKARAAGIHLIVATQRPSVDVVTGLIKANFPARLSFRVATRIDSRTILDQMGADKLLGRGDMLLMLPGQEGLRRVHGAFVTDLEVKNVIDAIKAKCKPRYDERIISLCEKALEEEKSSAEGGETNADEYDDMYDKCVELVVAKGHASTSMIQRAFRLGYNRAARIIDMMEREGIIGPMDGAKPREVLVGNEQSHQEGSNS